MKNDPDLEVYRAIFLAKDDPNNIDISTHVAYQNPALRDLFKRAAQGENIVTAGLLRDLIGAPVLLNRNTLSDPTILMHVTHEDSIPLFSLLVQRAENGSLSAYDQSALEIHIKNIAHTHNFEIDFVRDFVADAQQALAQKKQEMDVRLSQLAHYDPRVLATIKGQGGFLDKKEREDFLAQSKMRPGQLTELIDSALKIYNYYTKSKEELSITFSVHLNEHSDADGLHRKSLSGNAHIITAPDLNNASLYKFFRGDSPALRELSGTPEQWEFLIALHESEHAKQTDFESLFQKITTTNPDQVTSQKKTIMQYAEIDADMAIMRAIDELGIPAMKQDWLQARHVASFMLLPNLKDIRNEILTHDTATFIRIFEKSGQHIDLDIFRAEKALLLEKVFQKLENEGRANEVSNVMGAVLDILIDDVAETDPSKKLTAIQRDQAITFISDANALGYTANPNYPKAKPAEPGETGPSFATAAQAPRSIYSPA
jgi:hypothetical protein